MKLRLILFRACKRNCQGCCNNDWDFNTIPYCFTYKGFDEILLTGGEPMLYPAIVEDIIAEIRKQTSTPIYMYTAETNDKERLYKILKMIDGVTVTLHEQTDVLPFIRFAKYVSDLQLKNKSLRLNIFSGVMIEDIPSGWIVKDSITWINPCPLPTGEILQKYLF